MWFIGTLLTLISDFYDYFDIFNQEISILREKSNSISQLNEGFINLNDFIDHDKKTSAEIAIPSNNNLNNNNSTITRISQIDERLKKVQDKKVQITRNLMKNTADLMVAGNGGYKVWSLNNGIIGLCGCISSFIGLYESWPSNVVK
ncbi:predicted protein [Naegleria gruberi]|uniref:Predicted protein n=1 Tax=Naegleria gruberi TaxID=5762 RepID=D2VBR8_NAEGR|nr:Peroxin 11b (Pex11b), putative [Naegleria gruberi]EFC45845.1 predicted protein [Naegleria gruberi]|eukprot:XP_002678589.1 predicted protein [Naegleria gruberi strain NEG-M]